MSAHSIQKRNRQRGFSLVELIVVIVVSALISTVTIQLIQQPVDMYQAQSRRAKLVDIADTSLRRMTREIRDALPNSIRISCGGRCLEFLNVQMGGRYRAEPVDTGDPINDDYRLSFDPGVPVGGDIRFEVLGSLPDWGSIATSGSGGNCRADSRTCLVVYNTGLAGSSVYAMNNAATITNVNNNYLGTGRMVIEFDNDDFDDGSGPASTPDAFPFASPDQRFYVVDTPVTFLCDTTGEIYRYFGYSIRSAQQAALADEKNALDAATAANERSLLVNQVSACQFSYAPGTATRNAVVSLELTIQEGSEVITLLQQAHVSNLP